MFAVHAFFILSALKLVVSYFSFLVFERMNSRRSFIWKSKHRKNPNNVIIEGRFGIVVLKATTAVRNFLTTCAVVDSS
jgi:hypothetical protein